MGKRKAIVEEKSPISKKTKTSVASEKKSKRKSAVNDDDDNDDEIVVTKKKRASKIDVVEEEPVVKSKGGRKAKVIEEKEPSPVKEVKEPAKRGRKPKKVEVVEAPIPSTSVSTSASVSVSSIKLPASEPKIKTIKRVAFEGSTITGKEYNEEGEIFQQVEQMWTVFDTVVLIALVVNALILIGSKYSPEYTKYLGIHVQYTTLEEGFMSYIKLVMWSFPIVVSLYTTIVLPFILIEKGISRVLGFNNPSIVRVQLLFAIILGSIVYYFDPKLTILEELEEINIETLKNTLTNTVNDSINILKHTLGL